MREAQDDRGSAVSAANFEGDDVNPLIEEHRGKLPMSDQIITFDPPR